MAKGFQSPPAPSLVVSIASFSLIIVTSESGNRCWKLRADVRPMTPPPITAIFGFAAAAMISVPRWRCPDLMQWCWSAEVRKCWAFA